MVLFALPLRVRQVEDPVMRENRPIRLIKKRESLANAELLADAEPRTRPKSTEREIKTVVSRWVKDHRQRSEEFRRTFASLWQAGELPVPTR
jgi:hypothetical protein